MLQGTFYAYFVTNLLDKDSTISKPISIKRIKSIVIVKINLQY